MIAAFNSSFFMSKFPSNTFYITYKKFRRFVYTDHKSGIQCLLLTIKEFLLVNIFHLFITTTENNIAKNVRNFFVGETMFFSCGRPINIRVDAIIGLWYKVHIRLPRSFKLICLFAAGFLFRIFI